MSQEFAFKASVVSRMEGEEKSNKVRILDTRIRLDSSANLDAAQYQDEGGAPTRDGCGVITDVLINGLVANIHASHQQGWRDSAEHLRYVIKRLEEGFAEPTDVHRVQIGSIDDGLNMKTN